jgi:hypothetical protein
MREARQDCTELAEVTSSKGRQKIACARESSRNLLQNYTIFGVSVMRKNFQITFWGHLHGGGDVRWLTWLSLNPSSS